MADQINHNENTGNGNIMRELSDIKRDIAVNTETTQNIKESLAEVKETMNKIETNYIKPEQHKVLADTVCDHETRLRDSEKSIIQIRTYGAIALVLLGIIEFLISKYL